ncbi:hypothetical protein D3C81_2000990 [compost metagenome]
MARPFFNPQRRQHFFRITNKLLLNFAFVRDHRFIIVYVPAPPNIQPFFSPHLGNSMLAFDANRIDNILLTFQKLLNKNGLIHNSNHILFSDNSAECV